LIVTLSAFASDPQRRRRRSRGRRARGCGSNAGGCGVLGTASLSGKFVPVQIQQLKKLTRRCASEAG
jgi:hypothetical protein